MQILNETLAGISAGNKSSFQNLAVTPLNIVLLREPDYLTLDEALASGAARVTEVSGDVGRCTDKPATAWCTCARFAWGCPGSRALMVPGTP
jgi:hypothetical protein